MEAKGAWPSGTHAGMFPVLSFMGIENFRSQVGVIFLKAHKEINRVLSMTNMASFRKRSNTSL
jgi:hypothetical protein